MKYRSISVKECLWRELKTRAAREGLSINHLIEDLLCAPEPPDPGEAHFEHKQMASILTVPKEVADKIMASEIVKLPRPPAVGPIAPVEVSVTTKTVPHSPACKCFMCKPPKEKK